MDESLRKQLENLAALGIVGAITPALDRTMPDAARALGASTMAEIPQFAESGNPDVVPELGEHARAHFSAMRAMIDSGRVASFDFVRRHAIETVLELGCGDGNQLALAHYPHYRGYDVSRRAVEMCRARFRDDASKAFLDYDPQRVAPGSIPPAQLALSLDVVFHLVEDEVFDRYMTDLFAAASRFVIVYASNTDRNPLPRPPQIRHRRFTDWVTRCAPGWRLCEHVPNRHPFRGDARTGSRSEFFVFERGPG